ncbi:MAG: VOC family protein [Deltaproteobacteria bacterium]|nr:VOC family protein [Deltaproteobacteria bacterium]
MIRGINHVTLSVSDIDRSFAFYRDVVGLRPIARWARGAYFLAGDQWIALSLDAATRMGALAEYSHLAFDVSPADFDSAAAAVRDSDATVFKENRSEGASLYFLDPDGHKLELHASTLEARLAAMQAEQWDDLELFEL